MALVTPVLTAGVPVAAAVPLLLHSRLFSPFFSFCSSFVPLVPTLLDLGRSVRTGFSLFTSFLALLPSEFRTAFALAAHVGSPIPLDLEFYVTTWALLLTLTISSQCLPVTRKWSLTDCVIFLTDWFLNLATLPIYGAYACVLFELVRKFLAFLSFLGVAKVVFLSSVCLVGLSGLAGLIRRLFIPFNVLSLFSLIAFLCYPTTAVVVVFVPVFRLSCILPFRRMVLLMFASLWFKFAVPVAHAFYMSFMYYFSLVFLEYNLSLNIASTRKARKPEGEAHSVSSYCFSAFDTYCCSEDVIRSDLTHQLKVVNEAVSSINESDPSLAHLRREAAQSPLVRAVLATIRSRLTNEKLQGIIATCDTGTRAVFEVSLGHGEAIVNALDNPTFATTAALGGFQGDLAAAARLAKLAYSGVQVFGDIDLVGNPFGTIGHHTHLGAVTLGVRINSVFVAHEQSVSLTTAKTDVLEVRILLRGSHLDIYDWFSGNLVAMACDVDKEDKKGGSDLYKAKVKRVHVGFYERFRNIWPHICEYVNSIRDESGMKLTLTVVGHSQGAALATLVALAADVHYSEFLASSTVLITFASPAIFPDDNSDPLLASCVRHYRFAVAEDVVPATAKTASGAWSKLLHTLYPRQHVGNYSLTMKSGLDPLSAHSAYHDLVLTAAQNDLADTDKCQDLKNEIVVELPADERPNRRNRGLLFFSWVFVFIFALRRA